MCIYIMPCLIRSFTPGKFSQFSKQNRNNKGIKNWKLRLIEFSKKISVLVMNMGYFHAYFHNMNRDTFEHSQKISIMEPFANRKKFDFRYLTRFCTRLWRKQVFLQIILISSVWICGTYIDRCCLQHQNLQNQSKKRLRYQLTKTPWKLYLLSLLLLPQKNK